MLKEVEGFLNSRARHFSALIRQRPHGFFFRLRALKENRLEPDYLDPRLLAYSNKVHFIVLICCRSENL